MPKTTNQGFTLTEMTKFGRKAVKYGIIALVVMIVGRALWNASVSLWKALNPPLPPPPTQGFGPLPVISFPAQAPSDKPRSYKLETATGRLPSFGDRAIVHLMPKVSPNLLADQRAKEVAAAYGFIFEPQVVSNSMYRWSKSRPLESTLEMDINTLSFSLTSNFLSRPELLAHKDLPDSFAAVQQVKGFLSRSGLIYPDVASAAGEVTFLKAVGGELQESVSVSDAEFVQVDLNRVPIAGKYRMFTPEGYVGSVHAILTGALSGNDAIVSIQVRYHPKEDQFAHTYPLRSAQSAWQLLQAGEGYVADKGNSDQAVIRDVYLGYFDNFVEQPYLQPIYVFAGDGGFLGYVPAIDMVKTSSN